MRHPARLLSDHVRPSDVNSIEKAKKYLENHSTGNYKLPEIDISYYSNKRYVANVEDTFKTIENETIETKRSRTYHPISILDLISIFLYYLKMMEEEQELVEDKKIVYKGSLHYSLDRKLQISDSLFKLEIPEAVSLPVNGVFNKMGREIAILTSYNKKIPTTFAYGGKVFACNNGIVMGDSVRSRKHTLNQAYDIVESFKEFSTSYYNKVEEFKWTAERLQKREITPSMEYNILGYLLTEKGIPATVLKEANNQRSSKKEINERGEVINKEGNLWGVLMRLSEGLKSIKLADRNLYLESIMNEFKKKI